MRRKRHNLNPLLNVAYNPPQNQGVLFGRWVGYRPEKVDV
jgi:hypothetical protein